MPFETEQDIQFNTTAWKEAEIFIFPLSKGPNKYGDGVYRFRAALTLSIILPRRGWELIKKSSTYVYLKPPANHTPPFSIIIKIPSQKQVLDIANASYELGKTWMGSLGEWPIWYRHKQQPAIYYPESNNTNIEDLQPHHLMEPFSWLKIGQEGVWQATADKRQGEDFFYSESGNVKNREFAANPITQFSEGEEFTIQLTKYERNAIARKKCIEFHGAKCQVCFFDFANTYGKIGL